MTEYTEYRMDFIRTQPGLRRDLRGEDWDFGLVNFGYEACERVDPIRIVARNLDDAREQAERRWQAWCAKPYDDEPEGYWIVTPDNRIRFTYVRDEVDSEHGSAGATSQRELAGDGSSPSHTGQSGAARMTGMRSCKSATSILADVVTIVMDTGGARPHCAAR
jgi:hypothetical protein